MADFEVIFMDAGQGDCTLIVYPDGTLTLVDCGSTKSGAQAFEQIKIVVNQRLKESRCYVNVVLTHPDEDHYNLLSKLDVKDKISDRLVHAYYGGDIELYRNGRENDFTYNFLSHFKEHGLASPPDNTTSVVPEDALSRAGVNVTILAANCTGKPAATSGHDKNSNSIVLLVEYQGAKIFLMGDAFEQTEKFIMSSFKAAGKLARLQKQFGEHVVLKMGHHGSDTSTHSDWVKLIQPEVLVVSSGTKAFNGKGMPTKTHLVSTVQNSQITTTDIDQTYVVFDETKRGVQGQDFVTMPKTKQAIWTTCYQADWQASNLSWFESGQTWYYGVEKNGKKTPNHWYGYTGYET
jgi:beta-lactamase superfamily II metal-dependent hydrolase